MSGGVDSSVAAALLKEQGHRVLGATLKLLRQETGFGCCGSTRDIDDARAVCSTLGMPHYVLDFADDFQKNILDPFVNSYLSGETPNPCIACNRFIKFDALLKKAIALGADAVATGHYAQIDVREENGKTVRRLRRAVDLNKDQTYVLYHLGQAELSQLLFPIGGMTKPEVRDAARRFNLKTAEKDESMEICFVPNADTAGFIKSRGEGQPVPSLSIGPIKDLTGKRIGEHRGVAYYTRGQRSGLGLSIGRPAYVVDIDPATNTLFVGEDEEGASGEAEVREVVWSTGNPPQGPVRCSVQIRSRHAAALAVVTSTGTLAHVRFDIPQRAVAPGQSAVFYDGDLVIGGGILLRSVPVGRQERTNGNDSV
ncbi:MAG: tRNA 2-thiouridine(34) synthase MnmA [Elusimicrobia bacterium]|nr:tRNA 2-thiouridine(34) synthase MnmA [Elusimicrobiota bacterium]